MLGECCNSGSQSQMMGQSYKENPTIVYILLIFPYSHQFYRLDVLLFVAIVAADGAQLLVHHTEDGLHGLVVSNAFGVVAAYYAFQYIGCLHGLLLRYLIVPDDAKNHFRGNNGQTGNLFIGKELVCYLYYSLLSYLL